MPRWRCPECEREFGRTHESHECAPALSIDEDFDDDLRGWLTESYED